ncbi:hypothetical protein ACFUP3_20860 [Bacillus paralicheniformis]|uniref:hypothetical protein n=1 Tax=Bacillus paralicheniformis TaxID=1648923 RepID=UPI00363192CF
MKIGDKVFVFDANKCDYKELYIVGENKISWILSAFEDAEPNNTKIVRKIKKTVASKVIFVGEEELEQHLTVKRNLPKIIEEVKNADYSKIKQISEILGLELK